MSKVIITGGLGFIGSHTAIRFYNAGYDVKLIDNLSRPAPNLVSKEKYPYNYSFFEKNYPKIGKEIVDVRNLEVMQKIFKDFTPNIIIHAAGQTSAVGSIGNPREDFENNVIGLYNTLDLAKT